MKYTKEYWDWNNSQDDLLIKRKTDNELIAEFWGMELGDDKTMYYDDAENLHPPTPINELKFHSSWDWLMPVVKKCFCTGDNTFEWDAIMDAMWTCDIKIVHSVVVEFINQHNIK